MSNIRTYRILEIPRYYESYDNGRVVDYPDYLPLPRIGEEIMWIDKGLDKTYYLKVINVKHRIDLEGYNEIKIVTEHITD